MGAEQSRSQDNAGGDDEDGAGSRPLPPSKAREDTTDDVAGDRMERMLQRSNIGRGISREGQVASQQVAAIAASLHDALAKLSVLPSLADANDAVTVRIGAPQYDPQDGPDDMTKASAEATSDGPWWAKAKKESADVPPGKSDDAAQQQPAGLADGAAKLAARAAYVKGELNSIGRAGDLLEDPGSKATVERVAQLCSGAAVQARPRLERTNTRFQTSIGEKGYITVLFQLEPLRLSELA